MTMAGPPGPTLAQVKAWLATVVGPIVEALRTEHEMLAEDNPTARVYAHAIDFEFLWGSRDMVSRRYEPNMRTFFKHYPEVLAAVAEHDQGLAQLRSACSDALDALLRSPDFEQLCSGKTGTEKRALAQDVINGVTRLESYYPLADFWNEHAARFLALRHDPVLAPFFNAIASTLAELRERVRVLLERMSTLQERLAEEHGLPPVDPELVDRL